MIETIFEMEICYHSYSMNQYCFLLKRKHNRDLFDDLSKLKLKNVSLTDDNFLMVKFPKCKKLDQMRLQKRDIKCFDVVIDKDYMGERELVIY